MRIFALSDLHTDYAENLFWLKKLSENNFKADILITAGDITDKIDRLKETLSLLRQRFNMVFYVPGNHDLWMREKIFTDSLDKFRGIIKICEEFDICTTPKQVIINTLAKALWIVPLFSWYLKPEEGNDSLYLEKPGEDPALRMWKDNSLVKWPENIATFDINKLFLDMNEQVFLTPLESTVISFSHFLPRKELMFSLNWEKNKARLMHLDRNPAFNFSRVAGTAALERQIRKLNSTLHVFGHQHRNRNRNVDGVHYISHCLGYPGERRRKSLLRIEEGPLLVWDEDGLIVPSKEY